MGMMRKLSIRETRAALAEIEEMLEREGELVITRHGRPVARLLPAESSSDLPDPAELRARMPRLRTPSAVSIREDRDARG